MIKNQFEELLQKLSDIRESINYVGNMLEDHVRHSSDDRGAIAKAIYEAKKKKL